jgi:hypothetical protein
MKKGFTFLISVFTMTLLLSASLFAQRTTGDIEGTVTDPNGAVIPGASVTVTGKTVGFKRTVTADDDGVYRITQIPPGDYSVSVAEIKGFKAQTVDINVGLNNTTRLDLKLTTSVGVVVDVTGTENLIDPTETKAQTNFSTRQIEALPKGTGFTSLLKLSTAVRPEPLGGQLTINGATGPENSFMIDGQETQNFKNGLLNTNNDIPYQAVQEIQVKSSGFEAEFGGATGGVVSAVTKSGSNEFHGEAGLQLMTQKLNAGPRPILALTNSTTLASSPSIQTTGQFLEYFPQQRDSGVNEYPTFSLGGPIVKDRLWFFGIHSPRVVNTDRTVSYVQGFGSARAPRALSSAIVNAGGTPVQTFRDRTVFNYSNIRLDAAPHSTLRWTGSFTWNPIVTRGSVPASNIVNGSPGTATLGGVFYQGSDLAKLQGGRQNSSNFRTEGIWTPTSNLVALFRYTRGFQNQKLNSYGIATDPFLICQSVPAAYTAQAGCSQGFSNITTNIGIVRDISLRQTYDANLTYLFNAVGRHELKGGYQRSTILNDVSSGNIFGRDGGQGRTYLYYGTGVTGLSCTFVYVQWTAGCPTGGVYPLPTLPAGVSVIGTGVNYQFGASGKATDIANTVFFQDKWQPTSRLTLNLGLRLENEQIPAFNSNAIDLKWGWKDKIAPRLGASYALTADGKTKIAGFYGRFFDRLKFALPLGSFGGNFYHVSYFYITSDHPTYNYYTVGNLKGNFAFPAGGVCPITPATPNSYICDQDYRIASNTPGADPLDHGAVDPNVKPYRQDEYTFEFQREIFRSTAFTARYLRRDLKATIEDAGVPTAAGEAYVIGNPGQGLAASVYKQLGYNKAAVPERKYNALQLEMDTRYMRNIALNLNYTYSRLYGNYSGLANPDELSATGGGRTDPNVSRGFDEPWVGFTASGKLDNGLLPLDRPHVFKASGTYSFNWWDSRSNNTDLSFFTTVQSGTPRTSFVRIMNVFIVEANRGNLGRTPTFTQTDFNLTHKYKFGRDQRFAMAFDFNVVNAFNENKILAFNQNKSSTYLNLTQQQITGSATGTKVQATNILTSAGVTSQYAAAEAATCADSSGVGATICGINVGRNLAFGQPISWQDPRTVRFGFRFIF